MAESKHTKGPWLSRWLTDDGEMEIYVKRGRTICPIATIHVGMVEEDDDGNDAPDPDCADMANVRLIQGAPELLAVAEMALKWFEELGEPVTTIRELWSEEDTNRIRAALAAVKQQSADEPRTDNTDGPTMDDETCAEDRRDRTAE